MTRPEPLPVPTLVQETAWVHQLARQLVRDEHLAADVAQDAMVVGLDGAGPADPQVAPRGWLAGITRRLALQALRKRREREVRELLAARARVDDPEQRAAERLRVHAALTGAIGELAEPYRTALTLRFFEGRSPRAIARLRGHTPEAVRQHVHRGLGMLRQKLDREFGERRAWIASFVRLGLVRPFVGLPFPATGAALAVAAVVLLAIAVVVVLAWQRGAAPAPQPDSAVMVPDPAARTGPPNAEASQGPVVEVAQDPAAVAARVHEYLTAMTKAGAFAGAVLVARGGHVICERAYGSADLAANTANEPTTRFKLMSTSKAITAVAVMRLVQAGALSLDDRVGKHLAAWPAAWEEVTVHDLLDHTSGIANLENEWAATERATGARGLVAWPAFAKQLTVHTVVRAGGEKRESRYSNFNFELAGMVAEAVSKKPFRELLRDEVFAPAGMKDTGFDDGSRASQLAVGYFFGAEAPQASEQDMSIIQAAGGLWSTVGDLYRLDRALRGETLLTAATRAAMLAPREGTFGYACGWSTQPVHGRRCAGHSGGANGFVADLLRFPDDDACVVVLSNYAFAPIMRISRDVAGILFGREVEMPVPLTSEQLDACAGTFVAPANAARMLVVRRAGERLLAFDLWPGNERCNGNLLVPLGAGRFQTQFGEGAITIDGDGAKVSSGNLGRRPFTVSDAAAWLAASGELQVREHLEVPFGGKGMTPVIGEGARFGYVDKALRLRIRGSWPAELEVVPVTGDLAIALASPSFGTLMHREREGLRWTRADGTVVTFRRAR